MIRRVTASVVHRIFILQIVMKEAVKKNEIGRKENHKKSKSFREDWENVLCQNMLRSW